MRRANVFMHNDLAGELIESDAGTYQFKYCSAYLARRDAKAISLTLPLRVEPYESKVMFSFFDGLIPEGWLLELAVKSWKIDRRDRMGLLMTVCHDCIGAVHLEKVISK